VTDRTLNARLDKIDELNTQPHDTREQMEARYGQVWTHEELQRDFDALAFLAPFIHVRRKSDGVEGLLEFTHAPRWYFSFKPSAR
jgi:hypothetical protein